MANRPFDVMLDPGPNIQAGALIELAGDLEWENHFGWAWLPVAGGGEPERFSLTDFGAGLRHRFDFGRFSPYVSGGIRGYRLGASIKRDAETERLQAVAPGYYLGLGLEHRPVDPGKPASELGARIHLYRWHLSGEMVAVAELSYAALFR
jgi:hypothetical protein